MTPSPSLGRSFSDLSETSIVLQQARHVAVLGAHWQEYKPAYYVPAYLSSMGYQIYPINPTLTNRVLHGSPVYSTLTALSSILQEKQIQIDVVNVFRQSSALAGHVEEILSMQPLPKCVWLQLGISDDDFAEKMKRAGIDVVQNRCTLADHQRAHLGRI